MGGFGRLREDFDGLKGLRWLECARLEGCLMDIVEQCVGVGGVEALKSILAAPGFVADCFLGILYYP